MKYVCAFFLVMMATLGPRPAHSQETWRFLPGTDGFAEDALLDLSHLNEDVAGQTGFVRLSPDGESFVLGDGTPARFWGANALVWRKGDFQDMKAQARFLAKRGVNIVRFNGQIPQAGKKGGPLTAIDNVQRTKIWQLVAAMKDEGIYVTFSPYWAHAVRPEAVQRWASPQDSKSMTGLLFFDPAVQTAYKTWLRETLTEINPYTGIALKDDPALAIIHGQNEDSLLFWSFNRISGREARLLGRRFADFLTEEYGSLQNARIAWNDAAAQKPIGAIQDDWNGGVIALSNVWYLTRAGRTTNAARRLQDQTEFLTRLMYDWNAEVARFLKDDLGAPQLFNPGNWKTADNASLDDLERYSYMAGDVIAINRYVNGLHEGPHRGWAIVNGDRYREEGLLHRPMDFPLTLKQPVGKPYIIPETLWVPPIWQQAEAPVLIAAYQSLLGIDTVYWGGAEDVQWRQPQSANGFLPSIGKWRLNTPGHMGMFPAAALLYRKGYIDAAAPAIVEHHSFDEMWSGQAPMIASQQGHDPNRTGTQATAQASDTAPINQYSFLVGPVQIVFGSDEISFVHPDLAEHIDEEAQTVTSLTRQLSWDWGRGLVTVNAPKAQGVVGYLLAQKGFDLEDISLSSDADYASILVVPLDDQPISESRRLLVQMGTAARPTGWRTRPVEHDGMPALEVVSFGTAPWQVERLNATLTVTNPFLSRATSLDPNGLAVKKLPVTSENGQFSLRLPPDALYAILE